MLDCATDAGACVGSTCSAGVGSDRTRSTCAFSIGWMGIALWTGSAVQTSATGKELFFWFNLIDLNIF